MADEIKKVCVRFKPEKSVYLGDNYEQEYYTVKNAYRTQSALSYGDVYATCVETDDYAEICLPQGEWDGVLDDLEERAWKAIRAHKMLHKEVGSFLDPFKDVSLW